MSGPRRIHDMGGIEAGPVGQEEHKHEPWEKRIDAIRMLCGQRGLLRTDEMRRNIEDLGPGAYDALNYYERWTAAITNVMLQKSVITVEELGRKMAEVGKRWTEARKK
jgi:hypothetical protein